MFPDAIRTLAFLDFPADCAIEKLRQYEGAGIDAFITANSCKPFMLGWHGGDRYDHREYAGELRKLVRRDPGIRLFLQVGTLSGAAPLRWCQEHRDELARHADGTVLTAPSLASRRWREEGADAIRRLVEDFEAGDLAEHIAGYIPVCHGLEWRGVGESPSDLPAHEQEVRDARGDFSAPMIAGYRAWLRTRYGGDADALRAAWRAPETGFDRALPPTLPERDDPAHTAVFLSPEKWGNRFADYFAYYNDLNADLALAWCRAVKAGCGGRKAVGLFHGLAYGWPNAAPCPQAAGHASAPRLLDAPEVDFFGAFFSYTNRSLRGAHVAGQAVDSVLARGKVFLEAVECGTHLRRTAHREIALMMGGQHEARSGIERWEAADEWETTQLLRRDIATGLTKPGARVAWLEKRCPLHGHWFTHHPWGPMAYDSPEIRAELAALSAGLRGVEPGGSAAELAVFTSAASCLHRAMERKFGNFFVEGFRHWVLPLLGLPYDDFLLEDWALAHRDGKRYKAYVFLDALYVPAATRAAIPEQIASSGATALWFYAPGYLDETGADLAHCEALTGVRLGRLDRPHHLQICAPNGFGSRVDSTEFDRQMAEATWPSHGIFEPVFFARDPAAEVLGMLEEVGQPGLVSKPLGQGRSIYCAAPLPPADLVRGWLAAAGAHLYSGQGDLLYAGERHLSITCKSDGPKTVALPREREVAELFSDAAPARLSRITFEGRAGETRLFRLG